MLANCCPIETKWVLNILDITSGLLVWFNVIGSNSFSGGNELFSLELIKELMSFHIFPESFRQDKNCD